MLGIKEIGVYIPQGRISNLEQTHKFEVDEDFIKNKIGIESLAIKSNSEDTSDMACLAVKDLLAKSKIEVSDIQCLIVVTQNPDRNIPHVSAIVHGKLGMSESCAAFDISLGCSGYVYGLSVITSFMQANELNSGVLITCDPYSKIVNKDDKNTALLFGDAATATLIQDNPVYKLGKFNFGTLGSLNHHLQIDEKEQLFMNGRAIFNFAAKNVPIDVVDILKKNNISMENIDKFIFHQGSKYILDTIANRLKLPVEKVAYKMAGYGNTVSSSVPIILADEMQHKRVLLSGFGVGLSWSSTVLFNTGV